MCTSVSELLELGSFLMLRLLGSAHNEDLAAITSLLLKWSESGTLAQNLKIKKEKSDQGILLTCKYSWKGCRKKEPFCISKTIFVQG